MPAETSARIRRTYDPPPPAFVLNPWAAGGATLAEICRGIRYLCALRRARREVRMLNAIGVLPPGWDSAGRHDPNR